MPTDKVEKEELENSHFATIKVKISTGKNHQMNAKFRREIW